MRCHLRDGAINRRMLLLVTLRSSRIRAILVKVRRIRVCGIDNMFYLTCMISPLGLLPHESNDHDRTSSGLLVDNRCECGSGSLLQLQWT